MNILSMIKVKILVLIKWSYTSPNHVVSWVWSLKRLANLEHVVLLNTYAAEIYIYIGVCWINTLPLSTVTEEEASLVLKYVMELMEISSITDLQE